MGGGPGGQKRPQEIRPSVNFILPAPKTLVKARTSPSSADVSVKRVLWRLCCNATDVEWGALSTLPPFLSGQTVQQCEGQSEYWGWSIKMCWAERCCARCHDPHYKAPDREGGEVTPPPLQGKQSNTDALCHPPPPSPGRPAYAQPLSP